MPHEIFADEVAIDFPSVNPLIERVRDAFLGERPDPGPVTAHVSVTSSEAAVGAVVPFDVPLRSTCTFCGGRGETWAECCVACGGSGESLVCHAVRLALPRGVADGARFRFRVSSPDAPPVRVEVRVAIRSS